MKIAELKILIQAAEDLGHHDIKVMIDDGRDGQDSYIDCHANLKDIGSQMEPSIILAIR